MTDERTSTHVASVAPAPYDFHSDPDGVTREQFPSQPDLLLNLLLGVIPGESDSESSIGITLTVNGVVLSGLAVSFAHWSRLWVDSVTGANESLGGDLDTAFKGWVKERADFVARRQADGRPVPDPVFLHLKEAVILTGPHCYPVGLMRLRRDQIDAWSMGQPAD